MSDRIIISPPLRPIKAKIRLPSSKSISNRVLIMASLCRSRSSLHDLSDADDTLRLDRSLSERPFKMDCGAGGTTFRFLLAWAAVQEGEHIITGVPRLLERPHDDLVNALRAIGAQIEKVSEGFRVTGRKLPGGNVTIVDPKSSQFISALLLIAPYTERGIQIDRKGEQTSEPYVTMTCRLMQRFGADIKLDGDRIDVSPGRYSIDHFSVPRDWSAASFWYEMVALSHEAEVDLTALFDDELQGDSRAKDLWDPWVISERTVNGIRLTHRGTGSKAALAQIDLLNEPDLFQPLALTYAANGVSAEFAGLSTLPLKETDRIEATARVLRIFGGDLRARNGKFLLVPIQDRPHEGGWIIDPEGDHRMAMSAAALALRSGPITIKDPGVVEKSYPSFWADLQRAGFSIRHEER